MWNLVANDSHRKVWLDNRTGTTVSVETKRPIMSKVDQYTKELVDWDYLITATKPDKKTPRIVDKTITRGIVNAAGAVKLFMMKHGDSIPPEYDEFDIPAPASLYHKQMKATRRDKVPGADVAVRAAERAQESMGGKAPRRKKRQMTMGMGAIGSQPGFGGAPVVGLGEHQPPPGLRQEISSDYYNLETQRRKKPMKVKIAGVGTVAKATKQAYKLVGGKRRLRFEKV